MGLLAFPTQAPIRRHFSAPQGVTFFANGPSLPFALGCVPFVHGFSSLVRLVAFECVWAVADVREKIWRSRVWDLAGMPSLISVVYAVPRRVNHVRGTALSSENNALQGWVGIPGGEALNVVVLPDASTT